MSSNARLTRSEALTPSLEFSSSGCFVKAPPMEWIRHISFTQTNHRAEHRRHQITLSCLDAKHVGANYSQRLSGLNHFRDGRKRFAFGRSQKIHFELNAENFRVWRH